MSKDLKEIFKILNELLPENLVNIDSNAQRKPMNVSRLVQKSPGLIRICF